MTARLAIVRDRPRAVLYLRQSTHREESISLELQENAGREHAARMGYDVVAVESDPGISGRTWNRPAVQRTMKMLEDGAADVIVLWKWSRLSRSRKDWALAIDRADVAGGRIEAATEPLDTATASGRFARGVMTEYAAFQSEQIGEQWKETHARRRRNGMPSDGHPRFGYDKQPDGTYAPNLVEGPLLAEMYRRHIAGEGFSRIVQWLNSSGHTTKSGSHWSRPVITKMLDTGFGAGKIVQRPSTPTGGKRDWRISSATFHDGAHPGVITDEEWETYLARRLDVPPPAHVIEPRTIVSGLMRCDCGSTMHARWTGTAENKTTQFTCSRALARRDVPRRTIRQDLVIQYVREWVGELAADVDASAELLARQQARRIVQLDNVATLDRKIGDLQTRMGRITVRWSAGEMPDAAYDAAVKQLDADLAALSTRRKKAAPSDRVVIDPQRIAADLAGDWDDMSTIAIRNMLSTLIREIRISAPTRAGTGVWRDRIDVVPTFAE